VREGSPTHGSRRGLSSTAPIGAVEPFSQYGINATNLRYMTLVRSNIQFLTMVTRRRLAAGVRLAVPSWFGRAIEMKRVRQAAPLQPGRQSQWPIVKSQVLRGTSSYATGIASSPVGRSQFRFRHSPA